MPKNTKVSDIMRTDVAFATLPGSRDEVHTLLKSKKVSGVPVLKDGKLVGIVSRANLLRNPEEEQLALLMTRNPIVIDPDVDITIAAKILLDNNIRRLPVVKDDKLLGIISVADIVASIAEMDIIDHVGQYVNPTVVPVWTDTPLNVAARIMELAKSKAAPVIDSSLEVVGIITDRDIINASIIEDTVEMSDMSNGSDDDEWTWESMRDTMSIYYSVSRVKVPDIPVKDVMVADLVKAAYISGVSECALKMKRNKIDQIPVVNANQKFLGLLRDRNLMKAIIDQE
ncbi:CBS domain-containing protein [uncultured Methanolobus sp.]|jgi:Predicted transcriptional regulator, contains C-terminal CBS domains|uniref:CBS domain-containing protein n=1 Tax=uncultured Methanolobus sp. TaxID=218300 RepID=UPI0029C95C3D|nr:CBS domain-containing protein [uncultured Methanolobus sp.]